MHCIHSPSSCSFHLPGVPQRPSFNLQLFDIISAQSPITEVRAVERCYREVVINLSFLSCLGKWVYMTCLWDELELSNAKSLKLVMFLQHTLWSIQHFNFIAAPLLLDFTDVFWLSRDLSASISLSFLCSVSLSLIILPICTAYRYKHEYSCA